MPRSAVLRSLVDELVGGGRPAVVAGPSSGPALAPVRLAMASALASHLVTTATKRHGELGVDGVWLMSVIIVGGTRGHEAPLCID